MVSKNTPLLLKLICYQIISRYITALHFVCFCAPQTIKNVPIWRTLFPQFFLCSHAFLYMRTGNVIKKIIWLYFIHCMVVGLQGLNWTMWRSYWRGAPTVLAPLAPPMPPSQCLSLKEPLWKPRPSLWLLHRVYPYQSNTYFACIDALPPLLKTCGLKWPLLCINLHAQTCEA